LHRGLPFFGAVLDLGQAALLVVVRITGMAVGWMGSTTAFAKAVAPAMPTEKTPPLIAVESSW
jgi:hypothetical protein